MLLEFVTCAFAVFGTLSCDDGGNADAGEKFQELVLAYEEVLETKGDRKLRGLKDIHQQLDEIATRYPDADVTAKILSSNIVGINLSRVERAIQKLDPDFNKQTETIVVGDVSSSYEVMEAPYNDLIVQMASVPHMPKNLPIEVKAAPQKEVLVVSTKQQPPITLPTAKPKRETPVVVADIPLPIAKPEVQSRKQPVKQLASSMPKTADWNMLVVPTAFSGGSSFKPSSTWNNLGPQRSLAAIAPSQVIVAQVETDALDDEKVVNEDRKAEANDARWYLTMGYSAPVWERKNWGYNKLNLGLQSINNTSFKNSNSYGLSLGYSKKKWAIELGYQNYSDMKFVGGQSVNESGFVWDSVELAFNQQNLFLDISRILNSRSTYSNYVFLGVGKTKYNINHGSTFKNDLRYQQTKKQTVTKNAVRFGFGHERKFSQNKSLDLRFSINEFGRLHNNHLNPNGSLEYQLDRQSAEINVRFKHYFNA